MNDIYFLTAYGKLNEHIEGGESQTFDFTCEYGHVRSVFIRRSVPFLLNGEQYYDAITPYGYGGPVVLESTDREKLVAAFADAYRTYCRENRIVDEFVRFHPLAENYRDFSNVYEISFNRNTVAIDLSDTDYLMKQFSPTCRNKIRKAAKKGVIISVDEGCADFDEFIAIYYETMKKNSASAYYFFEKPYFEKLRDIEGCDLIMINAKLDGKLIGSSLFMCSDGNMHYHLSATDPEYYSYAANNLILATAAEYGHMRGYRWLHLGGGTTVTGGGTGGSFIWPVPCSHRISSGYGNDRGDHFHSGIDIDGYGNDGAPIIAAGSGTVILASYNGGYGECVMIDHGSGYVTLYGHLSGYAVSSGQYVSQGQTIGYLGSTGNSTGTHCHFEIRVNGSTVNPSSYVG